MKQSVLWGTAAAAAGIVVLAGCNSSSTQQANASPVVSQSAVSQPAAASPTASAGTAAFVPIREPFDPGHPARAKSAPASCDGATSTLAIEQCYEDKTETADASIDTVQQAAFTQAPAAQQASINNDDSSWLAFRTQVCGKAYQSGGTIDGINIAGCLLDESTARLDSVKNITPAEAVLKSTDSPSLDDVSWYTTPEGSRIGLQDSQGDQSGGAIIAWTVIAGSAGFVVNPAQFSYIDGKFTDAGKVQGSGVSGHHVSPGAEYTFSIDYTKLSSAPEGNGGGWVYAPGQPVAVWR
jgi:uncharacterized protein YecT (DUF1311 family)